MTPVVIRDVAHRRRIWQRAIRERRDRLAMLGALDDLLRIAVWEVAQGPGSPAMWDATIRDLVARGARLRRAA